jgi:hypothetical protein
MVISRKLMEKNLPKKGFIYEYHGCDHIFFRHSVDGKYTGIFTKMSHSQKLKDISGDLLTLMRKQLALDSNRQVFDLITCPIGGQEYNQILRNKGRL